MSNPTPNTLLIRVRMFIYTTWCFMLIAWVLIFNGWNITMPPVDIVDVAAQADQQLAHNDPITKAERAGKLK